MAATPPTPEDQQKQFARDHPFAPTGSYTPPPAAPQGVAKAEEGKPVTGKQALAEFQAAHPFATSGEGAQVEALADKAAVEYEKRHAATSKPPASPGPGDLDPEIEQIWAAIRKLRAGVGSGGGGGPTTPAPLELAAVDTTQVKVTFGTIAEIVPDNVDGNIDVSGTDGTWYFYFRLTLNAAGGVTAAELLSNTSGVPASDSDYAYFLAGEVDVDSGVIDGEVRRNLMFSQGFSCCNRDPEDPSSTPGTYNLYVGSSAAPG